MIDEYSNRKAPEVNSQVENKVTRENVFAAENKTAKENISVKENIEFDGKTHKKTDKINSRNRAMSVLTTSVVGVVGLVVAGLTNMINIKLKAKFDEVEYRDGKIAFSINVDNLTEKEYIVVYPERDTKKLDEVKYYIDDTEDGRITGSIDVDTEYIEKQLASGNNVSIKYVLNLRGLVGLDVERLFDRYVVKIDKFTSRFDDVEGYCNCGVDGYYYFKMNFEDDGGLFSNFEAYIIDDFYDENDVTGEKERHIAYCSFSDNLHEYQKIFVLDLQGSRGKLVIKYNKEGVEDKIVVETPIEL